MILGCQSLTINGTNEKYLHLNFGCQYSTHLFIIILIPYSIRNIFVVATDVVKFGRRDCALLDSVLLPPQVECIDQIMSSSSVSIPQYFAPASPHSRVQTIVSFCLTVVAGFHDGILPELSVFVLT
jgi:hypothetical protein